MAGGVEPVGAKRTGREARLKRVAKEIFGWERAQAPPPYTIAGVGLCGCLGSSGWGEGAPGYRRIPAVEKWI